MYDAEAEKRKREEAIIEAERADRERLIREQAERFNMTPLQFE